MRIVLDLEGGDRSPMQHVKGAIHALNSREDVSLLLIGAEKNRERIEQKTRRARARFRERLEVRYAQDVVPMRVGMEKDIMSWTKKRTTTLFRAASAVRENEADAMLTSGNTGVFAASASQQLGRKERRRPSLLLRLPTSGGTVLTADVGLDKDPRPDYVADYLKSALELAPFLSEQRTEYNIGTLNTGHEPEKGMPFAVDASHVLKQGGYPWKGHVEPADVLSGILPLDEPSNGDEAPPPSVPLHIAIGGGSWMNIWLKTLEATAEYQRWTIRDEIERTPWYLFPRKIVEYAAAYIVSRGPARRAKKRIKSTMGAAVVAGLKKFAMKMHGAADHDDIESAIHVAADIAKAGKTA